MIQENNMEIIALVILILAIAGLVAWFFIKNKKTSNEEVINKPSEPVSQPTPVDEEPKEVVIKPKFRVGDWITDDTSIFQIVRVENEWYYADDGDKICFDVVHQYYHLWTLADAIDGNILCTYECCEPKIVFILKGTPKKHYALNYYCYYNIMYPHFESDSKKGCLAPNDEDIKPATKKQCDLLFRKMKETGYEWDAEHKQLREIEKQEPVVEEPEPIIEEPKPQESELLYKVGLMSDMHYDVADSKKSEYAEDITNALNYFKNQGVDFIASCGDFAQYDFKDFDGFYNLYKKNTPDIRLYTCLGNHDYLLMYDEHNTMSESDRQMAWQNTIADLHCRTDVKDKNSSEAESDIHFFEYDSPWDAPKGTGTRTIKSKLNYWIERHGDIYVFLSVDYGKDPLPQLWGTMANAVNLLDENDKYVKQMKEYVKDTSYNEKLEEKFDYQFYHPNTMIWLKDIIEANKDKNIFVFTHHYLTHKAGGNTPSNGKWFYSQMRVWPYTSDERIRQRYYSGANSLCGLEFHFINKLNNLYKNVIWFSGHTHIKWDNVKYDKYLAFCDKEFDIVMPDGKETVPLVDDIWQYANGKYDYRRYTRKSENPIGDCGMNVHLPSLSKPIDITTGHGTTIYGASEGAIMEVWNDKIVINEIIFKDNGNQYKNLIVYEYNKI